jgi:hypothetical protein
VHEVGQIHRILHLLHVVVREGDHFQIQPWALGVLWVVPAGPWFAMSGP